MRVLHVDRITDETVQKPQNVCETRTSSPHAPSTSSPPLIPVSFLAMASSSASTSRRKASMSLSSCDTISRARSWLCSASVRDSRADVVEEDSGSLPYADQYWASAMATAPSASDDCLFASTIRSRSRARRVTNVGSVSVAASDSAVRADASAVPHSCTARDDGSSR
jgi:hypothetical protein